MRCTDDVSLWPWPLTLSWNWCAMWVARVMEYSPANCGDTTTIRCRFMGARRPMSVSGRDVIAIDRSGSSNSMLLTRLELTNCFQLQNSRFRKRYSKIGLSCNVAVPHWNTTCEFGANWYGNGREIRQPAVRGNFALEDMPQDVCQH